MVHRAPFDNQEMTMADANEATKTGVEESAGEKDLLDAVDEALENEAEDFVRSYVQKGGE